MVRRMPVTEATAKWVEEQFAKSIVPTLVDYIKIPNKSPMFDPEWRKNGHMDSAVELLAGWAKQHLPEGATLEVVRLGERTPVIFIDVPATGGKAGDTVMLYGHLDKQPEMTGWREGLGPWTPVIEGDKLYGRGGADDGYAIFASLTAINARAPRQAPARALRRPDRGVRGVAAATTCPRTSITSRRASASCRSSCASTRAARTTTSCGRRRRCAASCSARSRSRCSPRACTPATAPA